MVAMGGGTGLSTLLRGLKSFVGDVRTSSPPESVITRLTAIVTVTDEGGSSGRLRREFGMLPPGDIRNCLVALAEDEQLLTRLFRYRFADGRGLAGHNFGNLFLAALTHLTRDFAQAVRLSSEVLAIRGEIFPSTLADVRLRARLVDGRLMRGETRITLTPAPIRRLEIVPRGARPLAEALQAIDEADLITLGPGSLYTSLIPNLLVRGVAARLARARAVRVLAMNLMTQPNETRDYSASEHLRALREHAGGRRLIDYVVLNTAPVSRRLLKRYAAEGAAPVVNDVERIQALGAEAIAAPLMQEGEMARHDPDRLARLLLKLGLRRPKSRTKTAPRATRGAIARDFD
ncbi:MAG TPA: uridine diphosphate-N-acetylglucosamine-binding protein YvcK [Terriglobia bacterium]|nr:uridine diphosphate-N-acetylglucosamine-binding protein YvcK [Terriglobia bacterium]